MYLHLLGHENFRNLRATRLQLEGRRQFLVGKNGQGKSNLLEAMGYVGALRSFRTHDTRALLGKGKDQARLLYELKAESGAVDTVDIQLRKGGKQVAINGEKLKTLSELVGLYPTLTLHGGDLQLLEGPPGDRRRFLDLFFSMLSQDYLNHFKRYSQSLEGRNRLLKQPRLDAAQCEAFEREMAESAFFLQSFRSEHLIRLSREFLNYYRAISPRDEAPSLTYQAATPIHSVEAFLSLQKKEREKDAIVGTTRRGPHRDDFRFGLLEEDAKTFASEGQKRGLVVALRLAQCALFQELLNRSPILLADDIIGELDSERRSRFWDCFDPAIQVIATGTQLPDQRFEEWQIFELEEGRVRERTGKSND